MRTISMTYHHEGQTWWADSADLPGFTAAAPTLTELREEVAAGVAFELDDEPVRVLLFDETGAALDASPFARAAAWWSRRDSEGIGSAMAFGRSMQQYSASPATANA